MIAPTNRSTDEYLATVRHAIRTGNIVCPHPRGVTEMQALRDTYPEIAAHYADCGGDA